MSTDTTNRDQVSILRRRATDEEIAEWVERHNLRRGLSGSGSDDRAAFEDAESLHMTFAAPLAQASKDAEAGELPPLSDEWVIAVRKAEHFCPTELSTPERWKWKARYLRAALARQSAHSSAVPDKDTFGLCMLVAEAAWRAGSGWSCAVASDKLREVVNEVLAAAPTTATSSNASAAKCEGCNGQGMVGNILDSDTCPFCKGSGEQASAPAGSIAPDVEFKRLADTIMQATTNTERNAALREMAALFDARPAVGMSPYVASPSGMVAAPEGDEGELICVPIGLVAAACSVIRRHAPEGKLLGKLRAYTTGDKYRPAAPDMSVRDAGGENDNG